MLSGPQGDDRAWGGAGDDVLAGDFGNDRLFGGPGDDRLGRLPIGPLTGEVGNDLMDGGDGVDRIFGGVGTDRLFGGPGRDVWLEGWSSARERHLRGSRRPHARRAHRNDPGDCLTHQVNQRRLSRPNSKLR